ncbi:MAG: M42 family peptidase, partial [Clostridia bacterium]|nr:M42 family peptidase [Clostridia bacterium]
AGAISISGGGIKTASISVPCKYIHSSVSCMNKNDYLSCKELIEKIIENAEEI